MSSRKIAYFYDPDVGNFHYGKYTIAIDNITNTNRLQRTRTSNEAAQTVSNALFGIELWIIQENGGKT